MASFPARSRSWLRLLPICLFFAAPFLSLPAPAEERPPVQQPVPEIHVPAHPGPIAIDGDLDEPAWKEAASLDLTDFWRQTTARLEPTRVLLVNTPECLAIAFLAADSCILTQPRERDGETWRDDTVEVFLGRPASRLRASLGLEINASGSISDFRYTHPDGFDRAWKATGTTYAIRYAEALPLPGHPAGWILEMSLPWTLLIRELSLSPHPDKIRANFARWDHGSAKGEQIFSIWSDSGLPDPKPHQPDRYGWLLFHP